MGVKSWVKQGLSYFAQNSWVLMYHRVDDVEMDPWDLAVSEEKFEEQILWLKSNRNVLPLDKMVEQHLSGQLQKHSIAITFDDGYRDNFTKAASILQKHQVPATFFICTAPLFQQQAFWWDELQHILLEAHDLPAVFSLKSEHVVFSVEIEGEEILSPELKQALQRWRYPAPTVSKRVKAYLSVWEEMRRWPHQQRQDALSRWKKDLKIEDETKALPMRVEELKKLAGFSLFSIGAHTVTHPALEYLSAEEQTSEIKTSTTVLQDVCDKRINTIAYPYGSFNQETAELTKRLGFRAGFTTQPVAINKMKDCYTIGRFMMTNTTDYRMALR
jgi:peptidoglycan/xylan/chitin deacetylase (PgdA/CDA1 family)